MPAKFEYTTLAQGFTAKFPMLTYVLTQVNYWIIANLFLVVTLQLQSNILGHEFRISSSGSFGFNLLMAVILGVVYGVCLGMAGYYFERSFFRKLSLGKIILVKALTSLVFLTLMLALLRYVFSNVLIAPLSLQGTVLTEKTWEYVFYLMLVYYFFMTLIINFVNQVNKKFGPGVLAPLLLGRYRNPKEEERIFMFMDLKSSTAAAEKLGHLHYSAFIRDCFADINSVLFPYRAQVYQYVGDEIVLMWPEPAGLRDHVCIRFFFACKSRFQSRAGYYLATYGLLPAFKAGIHTGKVTAVEIGEIKKDIAYHGDTLNTAARIQGICNEFNKDFLASEYLMRKVGAHAYIKTEALGMILLRGKAEKLGIVSVDWTTHTD
jgi:adenylate cyclase